MPETQNICRRVFFRWTAGASALGVAQAMLPRAGADEAKQQHWGLRLATSSIHFKQLRVEEALGQIAQLGFAGVDIWSAHAGCPHLDDVAERLGANGLKQTLAEQKLALFAFSVYRGGYPRYARLLGDAGGGIAVRGSSRPCRPAELSRKIGAFLASLKPEIDLAEKHNSYLAIENHGHALLDSTDSFKAFVDQNKSPRVGIALAPYHVQARKDSVEEAIRICGGQLFFFYAWQHATGIAQLPGHGPTDFHPWIAALAKADYQGYVNPFMHGDLPADEMSRALATSRDYLRRCYDQAVASP
jgi:sugar phosphate isomerase/epimerase